MKVKLFRIDGFEKRLAIMAKPRGGDWLDGEIASLRAQGIDTVVSLLTDTEEEELGLVREAGACERQGIDLLRFPVEDRSVPTDTTEFRVFLNELVPRLQRGECIAIHCRMGIGKSSLLAACLLHRFDATVTNAFEQISKARGCTVSDTPRQLHWVAQFVQEADRHV